MTFGFCGGRNRQGSKQPGGEKAGAAFIPAFFRSGAKRADGAVIGGYTGLSVGPESVLKEEGASGPGDGIFMGNGMDGFWLCFVPLFVAVDAIGVLPMFVALTERVERAKIRTIVYQSLITASAVALAFLAFGPVLLEFLGITVSDFMIAGGILLIVVSFSDLLTGEKKQRQTDIDSLGAVPIGVPLITGPAVLTTCILLAGMYGRLITAAALIANILIAGLIFLLAQPITGILGQIGTKIVSKIASLLLTAIAVMLIRRGITEIVAMTAFSH